MVTKSERIDPTGLGPPKGSRNGDKLCGCQAKHGKAPIQQRIHTKKIKSILDHNNILRIKGFSITF